jgi:hypothetical protein
VTHRTRNRTPESVRVRPPAALEPDELLHLNSHPLEILDWPEEQRGPVLRRMEKEIDRWEAQMTPAQELWRQRRLRRFDPLETARRLVAEGW